MSDNDQKPDGRQEVSGYQARVLSCPEHSSDRAPVRKCGESGHVIDDERTVTQASCMLLLPASSHLEATNTVRAEIMKTEMAAAGIGHRCRRRVCAC